MAGEITMASKYPGKCANCGFKFPEGTQIKYNWDTKVAVHVKCPEPDYSGTEQKNIFDMWIERAQQVEHPLARADRRHKEEMWENMSPHLSQPDEDME